MSLEDGLKNETIKIVRPSLIDEEFERIIHPLQANHKVLKTQKVRNSCLYRMRPEIRRYDHNDWQPTELELIQSNDQQYWAVSFKNIAKETDTTISVAHVKGTRIVRYIRPKSVVEIKSNVTEK